MLQVAGVDVVVPYTPGVQDEVDGRRPIQIAVPLLMAFLVVGRKPQVLVRPLSAVTTAVLLPRAWLGALLVTPALKALVARRLLPTVSASVLLPTTTSTLRRPAPPKRRAAAPRRMVVEVAWLGALALEQVLVPAPLEAAAIAPTADPDVRELVGAIAEVQEAGPVDPASVLGSSQERASFPTTAASLGAQA